MPATGDPQKEPTGDVVPWDQLLAKYEQLLRMRMEREALESQGILRFEGEKAVERAAEGKALARRFPGALREMDELGADVLRARRDHLQRVVSGHESPALWACVVAEYHARWRHALGVKGWLGRHKGRAVEGLLEPFRAWYSTFPHRAVSLDEVDAHWLRGYQKPPDGRLHNVVWPQIGERFGMDSSALKELLFKAS